MNNEWAYAPAIVKTGNGTTEAFKYHMFYCGPPDGSPENAYDMIYYTWSDTGIIWPNARTVILKSLGGLSVDRAGDL